MTEFAYLKEDPETTTIDEVKVKVELIKGTIGDNNMEVEVIEEGTTRS